MSSVCWFQPLVVISGNLGENAPVFNGVLSLKDQLYPTTSSDEVCTEFDLETNRNFHVEFFGCETENGVWLWVRQL